MAEDVTNGGRISISEERLKLALTEMELRLRVYFDERLVSKADATQVVENTHKIREMDRGDLSPSHRRAIVDVVEEVLNTRTDKGWTARERVFGVVALLLTIIMFSVSVWGAVNTTSPTSAPAVRTEAPNGP